MREATQDGCWVVYQVTIAGKDLVVNALCEQGEWEALEQSQPGRRRFIRGGITSEGEAERLARGTSGDPQPRYLPRS
jgi:hypothetical protein